MGKPVGNIDHNRRGSSLISKGGAGHDNQPGGHPIGNQMAKNTGRGVTKGTGREHGSGGVANTGGADRGSHLVEKANGPGNHKQPQGKSIGAGSDTAAIRGMPHGGSSFVFRAPAPSNADRFRGTQNCGKLRVSGHSGAHMVGCRKR